MSTIRRARRNFPIGLEAREGKQCLAGARTVSTQPLFMRRDRGKARRRALLMCRVGLEALENRCLLSSFQWANDVSGNWNNAANWVDQDGNPGVPGPNDDATISYSDIIVTSSQSNSVGSLNDAGALTLTGGTFAVATDSSVAQLTVAAGTTFQVSGGTTTLSGGSADSVLSSTVSVASGATLDLTGGNVDLNSGAALIGAGEYLIDGATVNVNTALTAPADLDLNSGFLAGAGPLTNGPTTTLTVSGGTTFNLVELLNQGTLAITAGSGLPMAANSVIDNSGTLDLTGDGDATGSSPSGTINNTGTLEKSGGSGTSDISASFNDQGGKIEVDSGTLALGDGGSIATSAGGNYQVAPAAMLQINDTRSISGSFVGSGGGVVQLNAMITVDSAGATFDFPAGMLQWTANGLAAPATGAAPTVTNTGTVLIPDGDGINLDGLTLVNTGTVQLGQGSGAGLDLNNFTVINNEGTFDFDGADSLGGDGTINNTSTGAVLASAPPTLSTDIGQETFNDLGGTIGVQSGTLDLGQGVSQGGTYTVAPGADLELSNGSDRTISGTFTGSGGGTVSINTSDHSLNLADSGATFDFPAGMLQLVGCSIAALTPGADPVLLNSGFITVPANGEFALNAGTLENVGTVTVTGESAAFSINDPALVDNTGTIDLEGDVSLNGTGTLNNSGTLTVALSADDLTDPFYTLNNTGTIDVQSGTLNLGKSAITQETVENDGMSVDLTGGTWEVDGAGTLITVFESHIITQNTGGTVILNGPDASYPSFAGLADNGGSFTLEGGASFTTPGALSSSGTLNVGPGSTLAVTGAFSQASGGQTTFVIGGTPASGQYGQLTSTGAAVLGGTIAAQASAGYTPVQGAQYTVMTFPSQSGSPTFSGGVIFGAQFNPTDVVVSVASEPVDLAVTAVTFTTANAAPGQSVKVNYTVKNQAQAATSASAWTDSVYLSTHAVFDSSAILLGRTIHQGNLAGGGSYDGTLSAPLPVLVPGSYHVFVVTDSRDQVPDTNRANNVASAAGTLSATIPVLTPGSPVSGTLAPGESLYYQVNVPAGPAEQITGDFAAVGAGAVYAAFQSIPTAGTAALVADDATESTETLLIPGSQAGTYYLLVQGAQGTGSGQPFTLRAQSLGLAVTTFGPTHGANVGTVTVTLQGSDFTPETAVSLVPAAGGTPVSSSVDVPNGSTLYATFDLSGATLGGYSLLVSNGGPTVTAPGSFTVETGVPGQVVFSLAVPSVMSYLRQEFVTVNYTNVGDTDAPAPLLALVGNDVAIRLPDDTSFDPSGSVQFLAIDANGPAGILPPGYSGSISIPFYSTTDVGHTDIDFNLYEAEEYEVVPPPAPPPPDAGQVVAAIMGPIAVGELPIPLDWSSVESAAQPAGVSAAAWDSVWTNFVAEAGDTAPQFLSVLDGLATYLGDIGSLDQSEVDFNRLYGMLINEAAGNLAGPTLADTVDTVSPAPDLSLGIDRSFMQSIEGRSQPGLFGLGWTTSWNTSAVTDAEGDVALVTPFSNESFTIQSDGTFQAEPGDLDTLTKSGNDYLVKMPDGSVNAFLVSTGALDYEEDSDGNKVTAGYNAAGQMISLTHSDGQVLTLSYNAQGFVRQVIDPEQRVYNYAYSSGGNLMSVTGPQGTTTYTYSSFAATKRFTGRELRLAA
jgi:YD repeat-containing protein